jgi:hypothetical protein
LTFERGYERVYMLHHSCIINETLEGDSLPV